ncbi:MAG: aspartyl-phosphate phosphatase Spo0E family protein [Clostridia bacterium]|nr:aspartyl-phosphate phosphatase Spo0E family protein [Clostridia bacterium]
MLNDEICKKRDELNKSIKDNEDYDTIYKLSVELDELIAKYYLQQQKEEKDKEGA